MFNKGKWRQGYIYEKNEQETMLHDKNFAYYLLMNSYDNNMNQILRKMRKPVTFVPVAYYKGLCVLQQYWIKNRCHKVYKLSLVLTRKCISIYCNKKVRHSEKNYVLHFGICTFVHHEFFRTHSFDHSID